MALIGSVAATGSVTHTVVGESRLVSAGIGGGHGSSGSIGLVLQAGDIGSHTNASGSISFVRKNGGNFTVGGSILSHGSDDLVLSSSTSHGDIRFKLNNNNIPVGLMTLTSGDSSGWNTQPNVLITDSPIGQGPGAAQETKYLEKGAGLLSVVHRTGSYNATLNVQTGETSAPGLNVAYSVPGTYNEFFAAAYDEVVVNDSSNSTDFRVESQGSTHALYVDADNEAVGIFGSGAPQGALTVYNKGRTGLVSGALILTNGTNTLGSGHTWMNVTSAGDLLISGSTGVVQIRGGTAGSSKNSELYLSAHTDASSNRGQSIIKYILRDHADSSNTVNYINGYDTPTNRFIFSRSSTFGANQMLTFTSTGSIFNATNNDHDFRVASQTNTHAIYLDANTNRVYIGSQEKGTLATSTYSRLTVEEGDNTAWDCNGDSANTYGDFILTLRNLSTTHGAFAGIAFDVSTETDADAIGAAIVAVRHSNAGTNETLHDTDLVFATNDLSDDDLAERMRITQDGRVGIGTGNVDGASGTASVVEGLLHLNSSGSPTLVLSRTDSDLDNDEILGSLSWRASEDSGATFTELGKIIVQASQDNMDLSSDAPTDMAFYLVPNGSTTLTERMVLDRDGDLQIDGDLTVTGNNIKGSTGDTCLTLGSSGDVQIEGDLQIEGNTITNSAGTTMINFYAGSGSTYTSFFQHEPVYWELNGRPTVTFLRYDGTITTSDEIGGLQFRGSESDPDTTVARASMVVTPTVSWTSTNTACEFQFWATPSTATSNSKAATIRSSEGTSCLRLDGNITEDAFFSEGHQYPSSTSESELIEQGDCLVLINGELSRSSSPKQKNVAGIAWYNMSERKFNDEENGGTPFSPIMNEEPVPVLIKDKNDPNLGKYRSVLDGGTVLIYESMDDYYQNRDKTRERSKRWIDSLGNKYEIAQRQDAGSEWLPSPEFKKVWKTLSLGDSRQYLDIEVETNNVEKMSGFKVCDEGGPISAGDLLCTSSKTGRLMKQDDDLMHSYTVAKAMEDVTFDSSGNADGIYGYVYCG